MTALEKAIDKASKLLAKREDENEYHLHDVDRKWVIEAMMDYAEYCLKGTSSQTEIQGYICPVTKVQCDDECCVSAKDCHIQSSVGVLSDSSQTEISDEEIEKAAENYGWRIKTNTFSDAVKANELAESAKQDFIEGAKWQQERMYSEADKIMKFLDTEIKLGLSDSKTIERVKWYFETYFEQFKKK